MSIFSGAGWTATVLVALLLAACGSPAGDEASRRPDGAKRQGSSAAAPRDGEALSRETGYNRSYGQNPYAGYDDVDGEPIAVLWKDGTASALDKGSIDAGRDVGSAGAFSRELDGRTLTFRSEGDNIFDEETGSEWNVLGRAVAGELEGRRLEPVVGIDHFWFSWAAFRPETRVYEP